MGKDSVWLLMQGSPVTRDKVSVELRKLSGVRHVHDVNIWSLAPGKNVVTAHLAVGEFHSNIIVFTIEINFIFR